MAKTTKQTQADLEALNKTLQELGNNAESVARKMGNMEPGNLEALKVLQDQYRSLQNQMREVLQLQAEIAKGPQLQQVGSISSPSKMSQITNSPSNPSGIDFNQYAEQIRRDAQLTAKRMMDQLEAERRSAQSSATSSASVVSGTQTSLPSEQTIKEFEDAERGGKEYVNNQKDVSKVTKEVTEAQIKAREATMQYANALKFAQEVENKSGVKFDPTKTVMSQGGLNGRTSFDFQGIDEATGAIHKLQVSTDEAGNVFPSVQRKFRDFSQSIVRDVGELAKWSLAIALIYGPLEKLQQITTLMIENEVKLADATITINSANASTGQIFDTVAVAANKAGEAVNETIDVFTLAYRALGSSVNQTERYASATKLMDDALVLAKLSSLSTSQSIDTLSAAVRQTGGDFSSTTHLLDSWVKVTKIANVDMATLATGVATLGDAAEVAGIDTDHLNGIIAVLAENSNLSGQEVANAARALVSGLQSQQAQKALQDVGIATKDANGELRSFLDVIQQIREYSASGLISQTQLAAITLAAGGGTRRQSVYSSFIQNSGEVDSIAAASASANGDAQDALAKKTATAQTAITRLDNAFQSLAQTAGNEGGMLQIFKDITNTTSLLVESLDHLTGVAGKATPELIALGAAAAYLFTRTDPAATLNLFTKNLNSGIANIANRIPGLGRSAGEQSLVDEFGSSARRGFPSRGESLANFMTGSGIGSSIAQGIGVSAIPALYNSTSGEKFGGEKAGADIVGGILGTFVGGPAGGIIGTAIAEGFIRATTTDTQLANYFKGLTVTPTGQKPGAPTTKEEADKILMENQTMQFGGVAKNILPNGVGGELFGNMAATINTTMLNAILAVNNMRPGQTNQVGPLSVEQVSMLNATPEGAKAYQSFLDSQKAKGGVSGQDSAFSQKTTAIGLSPINGMTTNSYIDSIVKERIGQIDSQRQSGKLNTTDYQLQTVASEGARATGEGYFAGFGKEFMDAAKIKSTADAYKSFLDILTYGSSDSKQNLDQLLASIIDIQNAISAGTATPQQIKDLPMLQKTAGNFAATALSDARLSQINPANIVGDVNSPRTSAESNMVMQRTRELEKQFYSSQAGGGLSESDMNAYLKKNFTEAAEPIKDSTKLFYKMLEAFDPKFRSAAEDQLKKEGKLLDSSDKGIGFQQFKGIDRATLENAAKQSLSMGEDWQKKFNYDFKPEDQVAIAKDGVAKPLHADFKILALLLEKLVDQGQKQLDGMYNIPEGATFWVPLQAAYYGRGGAGDTTGTSTTGIDNITTGDGSRGSDYNPENIHNTPPTGQIGSYAENMHTGQSNAQDWLNSQLEKLKSMAAGPTPVTGQSLASDWLKAHPVTAGATVGDTKVPETRLSLNIQNNTSVLLDGRLIANIIKTYLTEDLLRASSGTGQSTKDYIV